MITDKKICETVINDDLSCVVIVSATATWADFRLVTVNGIDGDGNRLYSGDRSNMQETDPEKAEPEIKGHIKWDGCTEARIYTHLCDGPKAVLEFAKQWAWALNECHRVMSRHQDPHLEWEPVAL